MELCLRDVLDDLADDVRLVTGLVEWQLQSDEHLLDDLRGMPTGRGSGVGRALGVEIPEEFFAGRKSGNSRLRELVFGRLVAEGRSWLARSDAKEGSYEGYVSAGWKRTASAMRPYELRPLMRLSDANDLYSRFVGDPTSGEFALDVVVNGKWVRFHFRTKRNRLRHIKKLSKPTIRLNENGAPVFQFTAVYEYQYVPFSSEYIVGVDVGINTPAMVVVVNERTGRIVHAAPLSRRVASLHNSIRATSRQVAALRRQGRDEEAALHRAANVRKKRELAILIGQEVADIAHTWDNAVVAVEDLSWISNTMGNGRWNRGEVVRRIRDMVELNGGRVVTVNAAGTSKVCHTCGEPLCFHDWRTVSCGNCGTIFDRDVNAAANIAKRLATGTWQKMCATRMKSKRLKKERATRRTAPTRQSLKYPGRDRTKNRPTPKRNGPARVQEMPECTAREGVNDGMCSATSNDDCTVVADARGELHLGRDLRQHDSLSPRGPSGL